MLHIANTETYHKCRAAFKAKKCMWNHTGRTHLGVVGRKISKTIRKQTSGSEKDLSINEIEFLRSISILKTLLTVFQLSKNNWKQRKAGLERGRTDWQGTPGAV